MYPEKFIRDSVIALWTKSSARWGGLIYGYPLLNGRCMRLPRCIRLPNDLYIVSGGAELNSTHSFALFTIFCCHCHSGVGFCVNSAGWWYLRTWWTPTAWTTSSRLKWLTSAASSALSKASRSPLNGRTRTATKCRSLPTTTAASEYSSSLRHSQVTWCWVLLENFLIKLSEECNIASRVYG